MSNSNRQFVAFAGSRNLSSAVGNESSVAFVRRLLQDVIATPLPLGSRERVIVTGCAVGADEVVIRATTALGLPLRIYTIMDSTFQGGWKSTAVEAIRTAKLAGAEIIYLAGGEPTIALGSKLRRRTLRMLDDTCQAAKGSGVIALWSNSPGTALTIREGVGRGLPVVAIPITGEVETLPRRGQGTWLPRTGSEMKSRSFRWSPE